MQPSLKGHKPQNICKNNVAILDSWIREAQSGGRLFTFMRYSLVNIDIHQVKITSNIAISAPTQAPAITPKLIWVYITMWRGNAGEQQVE